MLSLFILRKDNKFLKLPKLFFIERGKHLKEESEVLLRIKTCYIDLLNANTDCVEPTDPEETTATVQHIQITFNRAWLNISKYYLFGSRKDYICYRGFSYIRGIEVMYAANNHHWRSFPDHWSCLSHDSRDILWLNEEVHFDEKSETTFAVSQFFQGKRVCQNHREKLDGTNSSW